MRIVLIAVLCILTAAAAVAEQPSYTFTVYLLDGEHPDRTLGAAEFVVPEGTYGRVGVAIFSGGRDFAVEALGDRPGPINGFFDDMPGYARDIIMLLDIYAKAARRNDTTIGLSGSLTKLTNVGRAGAPKFDYASEDFTEAIANGGACTLRVASPDNQNLMLLKIAAYTANTRTAGRDVSETVRIASEYSLYNLSANTVIYEAAACTVSVVTGRAASDDVCLFQNIYHDADGIPYLYGSDYRVENLSRHEDFSLEFDFIIRHYIALNPSDTLKSPFDFTSDKLTVTTQKRHLIMTPGERVEIEIPPSPDAPLPFQAGEVIVLTNPEFFIPIDTYPVMGYQEIPVYPEQAVRDKIEAKVIVQAYIDKKGVVKKAYAIECNRPGMGFEEAAVASAYKCTYSQPATQNGHPVGIWVSYKVEFKIDDK